MEDCIYLTDDLKRDLRELEKVKKYLKRSKDLYELSELVIEDLDMGVLRINMRDGYKASITFSQGCFEPYGLDFRFQGIDCVIRSISAKSLKDVLRKLLDFKEDIKLWVLNEQNDTDSMKKIINEEIEKESEKRELHNALLNAKFGYPRTNGLQYLKEHKLKPDDYVFKKGHFYNVKTNEVVYKLYD